MIEGVWKLGAVIALHGFRLSVRSAECPVGSRIQNPHPIALNSEQSLYGIKRANQVEIFRQQVAIYGSGIMNSACFERPFGPLATFAWGTVTQFWARNHDAQTSTSNKNKPGTEQRCRRACSTSMKIYRFQYLSPLCTATMLLYTMHTNHGLSFCLRSLCVCCGDELKISRMVRGG